ncbi:MAG: universal stress protein [Acidimicrobiia bacterium]|nr:universal stress protein [Acidimicrobiia bacterium]
MKPFVVGVDGSAAAAAALRWAAELAVVVDTEILALNAFERPYAELSPEENERLVLERRSRLAEDWIRPALEIGASVRTRVHGGDPREVVLELAEAEDASVLVLGRTGRSGGPGFLHLGSVVEHVAHHTRQPLAVIPETASGPIRRIILGVDGSPESLHAVTWCAEIARAVEATVVAVTVDEPSYEWAPASSPKNWRRDVEHGIDQLVAPLAAAGTAVTSLAQRNRHPADGLLDAASERGGDLLVIGTRGAGGFTGLRAGGVAMKVLHRASLPLVLVPPSS